MAQLLKRETIRMRSGFSINMDEVGVLRKKHCHVVPRHMDGNAPKDFIRVYTHGKVRRDTRHKWTPYIAKLGHKWYPNESVTEHLLTRIGELLGLCMAQSSLLAVHGQVRFLSQYFLGRKQDLVHGSEIFAGYLEDDHFVKEVQEAGEEQALFTFQFICTAVSSEFSNQTDSIIQAYTRMLLFDAIVGNNDRHHYNWGVVVHRRRKHIPYFSPIYDSARGLFWNYSEKKLKSIEQEPMLLDKYIENSVPRTGWEGVNNLNHISLIKNIYQDYPDLRRTLRDLFQPQLVQQLRSVLDNEFEPLMSDLRRTMILRCLQRRLELLSNAMQPGGTP